MKMELIQPFINAADAVLAEMLQGPAQMSGVSMDQEVYRRKGVATVVNIEGQIEGRIIFDTETATATAIASELAGSEMTESPDLVRETICELANLVIGNAVTTLNDQGFHFKVYPPVPHEAAEGTHSSQDTEALVMCFDTAKGKVFMNIAMRYNHRRQQDRRLVVAD